MMQVPGKDSTRVVLINWYMASVETTPKGSTVFPPLTENQMRKK